MSKLVELDLVERVRLSGCLMKEVNCIRKIIDLRQIQESTDLYNLYVDEINFLEGLAKKLLVVEKIEM